jgi:hypothetical protein
VKETLEEPKRSGKERKDTKVLIDDGTRVGKERRRDEIDKAREGKDIML